MLFEFFEETEGLTVVDLAGEIVVAVVGALMFYIILLLFINLK
jgi:hypothetical protein